MPLRKLCALALLCAAAALPGAAQLTWNPGSTVKVEQVIGDCDWQVEAAGIVKGTTPVCQPTASQTVTRFNVFGNGQGGAFEANGKMIFFFGDTISKDPVALNYHAADPIAWSTSTDPEKGLLLNFYTQADGSLLFVQPPGIKMGPDDIPNSGIALNGQIFLICNTGSDTSMANPQANEYSVLVEFNEAAQSFTAGRTISPSGGKFIGTSMRAFGSNVFIFGAGPYRASDVYLQMVPASSFAAGAGTQYFAGMANGQPVWTSSESSAVPVVQDNPLKGPSWPNDNPSVGNLSVVYSGALGLWLMTYDGGRQSGKTDGTYFTCAAQPWGPWAAPQLIFNAVRDGAKGLGGFIHDPGVVPDPPGDGLNGPTIGSNDPFSTPGGPFAPLMIERFLTVTGNTLKVYFNISTWNPYTVVRMRSEFTIGAAPSISKVANAEGQSPTLAPNTWADVQGASLAPDTRVWKASDFVNNQLPTQLDGVGVTVNGKPAFVYYISPSQINFLTPPDALPGSVQVQVTNNGISSGPVTVPAQPLSTSFFVFDSTHAAAVHLNGSYIGPASLYPGLTTPAKPGETVVLFGNGFGLTSTGSNLPTMPVIRIGDIAAAVTFAGLVAPGQYQFNVVVPANAPDGDDPLVATYAGAATQAGTVLTVQH